MNKELIKSFSNICRGLSADMQAKLACDIRLLVHHLKNLPGSFWKDPDKKKKTMKYYIPGPIRSWTQKPIP